MTPSCKQFDVGLSFSGHDRDYIASTRDALALLGVKSFYDTDFSALLIGQHLTERLPTLYRDMCEVFVPFLSKNYVESHWARIEKRAALEKAMQEEAFVLPVRLDATEVPGISSALGYLDWKKLTVLEIANQIAMVLLKKRVLPSDHFLDQLRASDYACDDTIPVSIDGVSHRLPLGQAHLVLNCKIAYERMARGSGSGPGAGSSAVSSRLVSRFSRHAALRLWVRL